MKLFKLNLFAIAGIFLMATIAVQSCKKDKSTPTPSGPSVTGVSTGASDTVGKAYTLTINGANLTGATVTTTAAGVALSGITATANTITGTITVSSTATVGAITLTITTATGTTTTTVTIVAIPLLGNYASSDSVASANLIAYWPFEGNANDIKGGLTATVTGTPTYTTGVRGQAYQGATGAYATLTPAGTLPSQLGSYTVSYWYYLPAQPDTNTTQGVFFYSGSTQQGELVNEIEAPANKNLAGDSVRIHPGFIDIGDAPNYEYFIPETFDTGAIGKWVFFTVTYNGGTSTYLTYQNGQITGANTAFSPPVPMNPSNNPYPASYNSPNLLYTDGSKATPLGNLKFTDAPGYFTIGSWPDGLFGQSSVKANFLGKLDELRLYNKALTQPEVTGLFLNGQAGR